jgi:hypothetical protein
MHILHYPFPESLLKAEDILYLPIRDHHVSPCSWHYRISLVERIVNISMLNRITNQRNLREISYRAWAGLFLLLELVGNINKQTMDQIRDQIANNSDSQAQSQDVGSRSRGVPNSQDDNNRKQVSGNSNNQTSRNQNDQTIKDGSLISEEIQNQIAAAKIQFYKEAIKALREVSP